MATLYVAYMHC